MKTFERLLVTEDADIKEIVAGILHAQKRTATAQHRPLMRGTHTKGVCVRGTFEVHDLTKTIADPILRERLARGLFAHPGVYPATIRFANADVQLASDSVEDVRAVSFAVDVPKGLLGPDFTRHDFSLNAATTFPINDAHAFAMFTRILEADGIRNKVRAFFSMSPSERWGLVMIAIRAKPQKKNTVRPYQRFRYWSNTPFRHGEDEAVKYSAKARLNNPAHTPRESYDMLRDELIRHVTVDERMSEFDFAIQLLDSQRMRRWGRAHDDIYWVENGSYEWNEKQAPFHSVATLRLEKGGRLSDEECQNFYIDVTEHSTPLSHPMGSLNRARWFAESASRHQRLGTGSSDGTVNPLALPASRTGAPLPVPPEEMGSWIGRLTVGSLAKAAMITLLVATLIGATVSIIATAFVQTGYGSLPEEHIARVEYPNNGFGAGVDAPDRQLYYYTPQGAGLKGLRYDWFTNLELPWGKRHIADPAVMRKFGFLVDPATARNPHQLPVGFTSHYDRVLNQQMLDVTCAACHTGQINVTRNGETSALRVDGGPAIHAFTDASLGHFLPTLISSLLATTTNPFKFNRFADRVGAEGLRSKVVLYAQLWGVNWTFGTIAYNQNLWPHNLAPTEEGFGRTDALARIGNTVFGENLISDNYKVGNAPVNFPALWNIWKLDWVQYNASVSQPMARNIGEAMGVGATYSLTNPYGKPLPPAERFRSTALLANLDTIEQTLWKLKPPAWPTDLLGPVDSGMAQRGKALFNKNCVGCHGPHIAPDALKKLNSPGKNKEQPEWLVATFCTDDIGTDSTAAVNFYTNTVDIRKTGLTAIDLRTVARRGMKNWNVRRTEYLLGEQKRLSAWPKDSAVHLAAVKDTLLNMDARSEQELSQLDPARLPLGAALSYFGTMVRENAYRDGKYTEAEQQQLDGFGRIDRPEVIKAYKSKPLAGIWATAPFLHNGSVPTIYQLLSPPAERDSLFQVGSREYDPKHLGLAKVTGFWTFDTGKRGNRNTGHEFSREYNPNAHDKQVRPGLIGSFLQPDERLAIIEHLKVRDDDKDAPPVAKIPHTCTPW